MKSAKRKPTAKPGAGHRAKTTRRALLLFGAQMGVAGVLAWRMRQLQYVDSRQYQMLADENRINMRLIPPVRGEIFDRHGRALALNRQNYRVVVIREQTPDVEDTLDRLDKLIEITPYTRRKAMKEFAGKSAFVPVVVAENLTWTEFAEVNANTPALPGVTPDVGWSRLYPARDTVAHVVGYVGAVTEKDIKADQTRNPLLQIPDFMIGKSGIERSAEGALRGSAGVSRVEVNATGRVIRELQRNDGTAGADIELTIDLDLQDYAMERLNGESAAVVLMDIANGDVLALASSPGFDPNSFIVGLSQREWVDLRDNDHRPLVNKATTGLYPPGSTFKMVVAMAALKAGVATPQTTVFCNGRYKLGNRYFHCWKRGGHGHLDMIGGIKNSCDVYFYDTARRVGVDAIAEVANDFGIGVDLGLEIPNVKKGLMPTRAWKAATIGESWQQGDTLNTGIGQGFVLASPLELSVMAARIANGVHAVKPHLIRAIGGQLAKPEPLAKLGVARRHIDVVRAGMNAVSNERHGTAYRARIADPEMALAGKTGTAQVRHISRAERLSRVRKNAELPWKFRDHALFVAFAPVHAPRYAISVVVEHGGGGSKVAAPIARDVMMYALYGGLPPLKAYPRRLRKDIKEQRLLAPRRETRLDMWGVGDAAPSAARRRPA